MTPEPPCGGEPCCESATLHTYTGCSEIGDLHGTNTPPHVDPLVTDEEPHVTDEEVEAAFEVLWTRGGLPTETALRAALEAAARARKGQRGTGKAMNWTDRVAARRVKAEATDGFDGWTCDEAYEAGWDDGRESLSTVDGFVWCEHHGVLFDDGEEFRCHAPCCDGGPCPGPHRVLLIGGEA